MVAKEASVVRTQEERGEVDLDPLVVRFPGQEVLGDRQDIPRRKPGEATVKRWGVVFQVLGGAEQRRDDLLTG